MNKVCEKARQTADYLGRVAGDMREAGRTATAEDYDTAELTIRGLITEVARLELELLMKGRQT